MEKVSVVIPTYNRFNCLLDAIQSIKDQTYPNVEIIVVNDCSSQKEYYDYDWKDIKVIHLEQNSKSIYGVGCPQRNAGMRIATGQYIAFCDDDDIWFPNKLELQIKAMKETGCKMSSTDGFIGNGKYNHNNTYKKYNSEFFYEILQQIYKQKGSKLLVHGFPKIWDLDFLSIHDCMICSSVIISKDITDKVGDFIMTNIAEDYDYWLRALKYTNCVYITDVCIYYDHWHGVTRG